MPGRIRWDVEDVAGADVNSRLDQMSILNRFARYVWELATEEDWRWEWTQSKEESNKVKLVGLS